MRSARPVTAAWTLLLAAACGGDDGPEHDDPPRALRDTLERMRADRDAPRHASDGGGRAWLELAEGREARATASRRGHWTIVYEAGPEGIAVGGTLHFIIAPFWFWSPPQERFPQAPGYTIVECEAEGVELRIESSDRLLVGIEGRPLAEGERIRLVYGAGEGGAQADRYAERDSCFWIGIDGDGDGVHALIAEAPTVDVGPGPPRELRVHVGSTARPGENVRVHLAVVDAVGNAGIPFEGEVQLLAVPEWDALPAKVGFEAAEAGAKTLEVQAGDAGVYRLIGQAAGSVDAVEWSGAGESNPLQVDASAPRILWGDLQVHTALSDGTGTLEDVTLYARDVAGLDVVALTDHDHWGMRFLDQNRELWERTKEVNARFNAPGRFVTVLGYEWTNWIHGHRHVLYFEDDGPLLSSLDEAYETPQLLWDALRGRKALTIAHHSAGGPVAVNWDFAPDPELEPMTEICSVHGSSEALDSPRLIQKPLEGNFVRDALNRGYRLGFLGSGDGHDGHPGLSHLASPSGGVAAIFSEELTRDGVYAALTARRAYATSGPRIILRSALDGSRMGAALTAPEPGSTSLLYVRAITCAPLRSIEVVRSGEIVARIEGTGEWDLETAFELEGLKAGEYVYVRVVQADLGTAWSSPFYVD